MPKDNLAGGDTRWVEHNPAEQEAYEGGHPVETSVDHRGFYLARLPVLGLVCTLVKQVSIQFVLYWSSFHHSTTKICNHYESWIMKPEPKVI